MAENPYLIPEPTTEIKSYKGTKILRSKNAAYTPQEIYALSQSSASWWAIGMAFYMNGELQVIVVSNEIDQGNVFSSIYASPSESVEFSYHRSTCYYSARELSIGGDYIDESETIIPSYSKEELSLTSYEEAAGKLLDLYIAAGGTIPGEKNYTPVAYEPVGWQDDGPPDISAENLNKMDEAIYELSVNLDAAHEEAKEQYENLIEPGDNIID